MSDRNHRQRLISGTAQLAAALMIGAALGTAPTACAQAPVEVDINKGVLQPLPIAVPAFGGTDPRTTDLGGRIAEVVSKDLERSGYFKPLDPHSFPEAGLNVNIQPQLAAWRQVGAQALVNGQTTLDADGRLRVDFRLWDVYNQGQLVGTQFTSTAENWRRVAHKIADAVYKRLTGEDGYFDTRIVFVTESGPRGHKVKRLAIMDQDGANPQTLTNGGATILSPRFSSSNQQITYASLTKDAVRVYLFDLETGRREVVGQFPGMAFAPRFSPDGAHVAMSVESHGNTDLYVVDLRSGEKHRLTSDPSIDTSPSYSPSGGQIVFTSDRGGSPQLYIMSAGGGGAHRISFGGGQYTDPVWSPKGDLIAATKQTGRSFHIVVLHPDGSGEHVLTSSFLDEGPTWAPNGRVLMFSHEETPGSGPRLETVDVSGRNQREVPYSSNATDPAWSPLLK